MFDTIAQTIIIGIGATALVDAWGLLLKRVFRIPAADFGLVGRWVAHMRHGRFVHVRIATAAAVRGERTLGWLIHYLIGVAFAWALIAIIGLGWLFRPTLAPALAFGLATVAAPFLIMQPAMGQGVAASKSAKPSAARGRSLATHLVFGLGLYVCAATTASMGLWEVAR